VYDGIFKTLAAEEDFLFSKPPLGLELIVSSDKDHCPKSCVVVFLTCEGIKYGNVLSDLRLISKQMILESDETLFNVSCS
jgi:hypothetical protein